MVGGRWQGVSHQLCFAYVQPLRVRSIRLAAVLKTRLEIAPTLVGHKCFTRRVMRFNVVVEDLDKLGHDLVALQSREQAAVHVNRGFRFLEGSRAARCRCWRVSIRRGH